MRSDAAAGGALVRVAAFLVACAAAAGGCGGDAPERPAPSSGWSEARIEGLSDASGVAAWKGWLLVVSSTSSTIGALPLSELKDGATVRARPVPLDVDGARETTFTSVPGRGPTSIALKHLWVGDQRFSGVAVAEPELLYVASESYRVLWVGPLEVAKDGSPAKCRFERAFDVPGAKRTKVGASDWHDYGDETATDGIAGIGTSGDDLVAVERAAHANEAFLYRLDRVGQSKAGLSTLAPPKDDPPGTRGFTDVAGDGKGFVATLVRRPAGGRAMTRVVRFDRIAMEDVLRGGAPYETVFEMLEPDATRVAEGMTVADGRLYLVGPGGAAAAGSNGGAGGAPGAPSRIRWRAWP